MHKTTFLCFFMREFTLMHWNDWTCNAFFELNECRFTCSHSLGKLISQQILPSQFDFLRLNQPLFPSYKRLLKSYSDKCWTVGEQEETDGDSDICCMFTET